MAEPVARSADVEARPRSDPRLHHGVFRRRLPDRRGHRQPRARRVRALQGWPALLLFALVVAYFYVGRRVVGGTLWDRFFGIGRPQPR